MVGELATTVPESHRRDWYEKILRPSVLSLQPERSPEFAASYAQQVANGRRADGTVRGVARMISWVHLDMFELALRERVEQQQLGWAHGFFFGHEVRGIKAITKHLGNSSPQSPVEALDSLVNKYFLPQSFLPIRHQFYIDVGLEYYLPRKTLFWLRRSHIPLMTHLMPTINPQAVARMIAPGSPGYFDDMTALLPSVSGFRYAPAHDDAIETGIFYVQCYSTEKGVADAGVLDHNTLSLPLGDGFKGTPKAERLLVSMYDRISAAHTGRVESCARIEIRMPFELATTVLVEFPNERLEQSILELRASEWW